jgi:hypothetical protein
MKNTYEFMKRQINKIKGWEAFYNWGSELCESDSLGWFKTKKEAKVAVLMHKLLKKVL